MNTYQKERVRLLEMLRAQPRGTRELPIMYRRHLNVLLKAGVIEYSAATDQWMLTRV